MALEMLQVQIRLVAVRAFILALGVLGSICGRFASCGSRAAGMRGQNTAPSLLSNDVQRFRLLVCKNWRMRV
jgi:hypothetical protein